MSALRAPFPYFGGKHDLAVEVWERFGRPKQYIEPFCGSAAVLLAAPRAASLEVVGDWSGFIANFWRATVAQPHEVARWADYPVSHIDLGARHRWLMEQRDRLGAELQDATWPGDARVAGWWLWGQCAWIGSGWCVGRQDPARQRRRMGVQAIGQIPHVSDAGMGVQAIGQIPHVSDAGMGEPWTSAGRTAHVWLGRLASRMERVRVIHGDWSRCMNCHYGGEDTAIFFDPPYVAYEGLYGGNDSGETTVAKAVEAWCAEHPELRVALCGHRGDYDLKGWDVMEWSRSRLTYGGSATTHEEAVWFSPACIGARGQTDLFVGAR